MFLPDRRDDLGEVVQALSDTAPRVIRYEITGSALAEALVSSHAAVVNRVSDATVDFSAHGGSGVVEGETHLAGLRGSLLTLRTLHGDSPPAQAVLATRSIARWAEDRGHPQTALRFLALAAQLVRDEPTGWIRAGRVARLAADYRAAEAFLAEAILLGEKLQDQSALARAHSSLGNVALQRGNYPRARELHERCLEFAHAAGERELIANANHDLLIIQGEAGDLAEAMRHARAAFAAYGAHHPKLNDLAHDIGAVLAKHGDYRGALRVHEALLPVYRSSENLVLIWSAIGLCAGALGNAELFHRARAAVDDIIAAAAHAVEPHARALMAIATGASRLRLWQQAEEVAAAALALAESRSEGEVVISADLVMAAARRNYGAVPDEQRNQSDAPFVEALIAAVNEQPAGR